MTDKRVIEPGSVQHVILLGLDRIIRDARDLERISERAAAIFQEEDVTCLVQGFMPDHAHFSLIPGSVPLGDAMQRLAGGHAKWFNRRHRRFGHLFARRYSNKEIGNDSYLRTAVVYIAINPLRGRVVMSLAELTRTRWSGAAALLRGTPDRLVSPLTLTLFGREPAKARAELRRRIEHACANPGEMDDYEQQLRHGLVDDEMNEGGDRVFREGVAAHARARSENDKPRRFAEAGWTFDLLIEWVADTLDVSVADLLTGRTHASAGARAVLVYFASSCLGMRHSELARTLAISQPQISKYYAKGRRYAVESDLLLPQFPTSDRSAIA